MASKYAKILGKLTPLPPADATYQAKVDEVKREILMSLREEGQPSTTDIPALLESISKQVVTLHVIFIHALNGKRYASTIADVYTELRRVEDALEEHAKEVRLLLAAYGQLLVEQYKVEGTTSLKLASGYAVRTQPEPQAQVIDKEAFRKWCIEHGLGEALVLPWPTTNSLTKERLLDGQAEPDGVKAYIHTKIVMTKP